MPIWGYKPPSGGSADFGLAAAGSSNYRAYCPDKVATTSWAKRIGARVGKYDATAPTMRLVLLSAGPNPGNVLAQTATFTPTSVMLDGTGGANLEFDLDVAVLLKSGTRFALAIDGVGQRYGHGMIQAASYPGHENYLFYYKDDSALPPGSPMAYSSTSYEGHLAVWLVVDTNGPPDVPSSFLPGNGAALSTTRPTFSADFEDDDRILDNGLAADGLNQITIELYEVISGAPDELVWQYTRNATTGEKSARHWSQQYPTGGTALLSGHTYKVRAKHSDIAGAFSDWAGSNVFTIGAGAVDGSLSTPNGKVETQTPGPFTAKWTHTAALSTAKVQVRLRDLVSGTIVRTMAAQLTSVVANNGTISITWAQTGFVALDWGAKVVPEFQARDSASVETGWFAGREIDVDDDPSVPTALSPTGGAASTTPPPLSCKATDTDDTVATGLTVKAEIINDATGAVISTRAMALRSGTTDTWDYQTVVGVNEIKSVAKTGTPTAGTFTLTLPATSVGASGTTAAIQWNAAASAVKSALEALACVGVGNVACTGGPFNTTAILCTFQGALAGEDIGTMTATSSLTGGGVTAATTTGGVPNDLPTLATYRWRAYAGDGTVWSGGQTVEANATRSAEALFVYASGPAVAITAPTEAQVLATLTPTIVWTVANPAAYRVKIYDRDTGLKIHDSNTVVSAALSYSVPASELYDGHFFVQVTETDTFALEGTSPVRNFDVTLAAPPELPFLVSPEYVQDEPFATAVRLSWDETTYPSDQFQYYEIIREPAAGTPLDPEQVTADSVKQVLKRITDPSQTQWVDYTAGSGITYKYRVKQFIKIGNDTMDSPVTDGLIMLLWDGVVISDLNNPPVYRVFSRAREAITVKRNRNQTFVPVWNKPKPRRIRDATRYRSYGVTLPLVGGDQQDVEAMVLALDFLDASNADILARDGHGRRLFCAIDDFQELDRPGGAIRRVSLALTEVDHTEDIR